MIPTTRCANFLDLPLEIRQQIYDYILPQDQVINFPSAQQRTTEKTITALLASHTSINVELQELFYKCDAHILVKPHLVLDIPEIEWDRFRRIIIKIDYYEDHSQKARWAGMEELVKRLSHNNPNMLPEIKIWFHESEDDIERWGSDERWTEDVRARSMYRWDELTAKASLEEYPNPYERPHWKGWDHDESDYDEDDKKEEEYYFDDGRDTWLNTTSDEIANPIAIEILDCLLDLPPCNSVHIATLRGLRDRRLYRPQYDPEERIFDGYYMRDLLRALELWLEGERGVDVASGVGEYGEPRLEQLAYTWYKGDYYCDFDLL